VKAQLVREWWPWPLWFVHHTEHGRYAGGFFTKRGALQWIADHASDYE
jgi:hypothetical protein